MNDFEISGYMTTKEAAEKWNVSIRQVQIYCKNGIIPDLKVAGKIYLIPSNVEKPIIVRQIVCNHTP